MHFYRFHGLIYKSPLPLLFQEEICAGVSDSKIVKIHSRQLNKLKKNNSQFTVKSSFHETFISQNNLFNARVFNKGSTIEIDHPKKYNVNNLARRLIGTVIPFTLHQKGRLVLHASAVENNNEATLFLGNSGSGKSTIAASMPEFNFISEDIASIEILNNDCYVFPSFPYIKLAKKVAEEFNFSSKESIYLLNDRLKRSFYKVDNFCLEPVKIKNCVYLSWGDEASFESITAQNMLKVLLKSYIGAFPIDSCNISSGIFMKYFEKLSSQVDFFKLTRNINDGFYTHRKNLDII